VRSSDRRHTVFPSACIHGRFQILHNDHFRYYQCAAAKYGRLYIGLTGQHAHLEGPAKRSEPAENPLAYWERVEMWRVALAASGDNRAHTIGPFPIEQPEALCDFVPLSCVCATTVREPWNLDKAQVLRRQGYEVDILLTEYDKALSGTDLRRLVAAGSPDWPELVPDGVADFLRSVGIEERLRGAP
jgi:nicotinamide mononucleotide adenylyltransferase